MKKFISIVLIVLLTCNLQAAWAHVQSGATHTAASSTTATRVYASNITSGSLLTACVVWDTGGVGAPALTDSLGNTWAQVGSTVAAVSFSVAMFYAKNSGAGANTVTATFSSAVDYKTVIAHEYSGLDTSNPLDKSAQQAQSAPGTGTDAVTTGNTPATTVNNELIFACSLDRDGSNSFPYTPGTNFTERVEVDGSTTTFYGFETEDRNLATAGAVAGTWTLCGGCTGTDTASIVGTFKEPGGGGATGRNSLPLLGVQ